MYRVPSARQEYSSEQGICALKRMLAAQLTSNERPIVFLFESSDAIGP